MQYYQRFLDKKPKHPIYHYTTQDGLIGIVKSKQLWATRIHYLNDSREFSYAIDLLENGIRNALARVSEELKPILKKISEWIERVSKISIYVCSFSEEKDLLSQWRGYTENGVGYSVGFKYDDILRFLNKQGFKISACVYDNFTQNKIVEELINHFLQNISRSKEKLDINNFNEYNRYYMNFINDFIQIAPILKHPSYREEKEWRLISRPIPHNDNSIDYRKGNSMLIPFYKFDLCDNKNNMKIFEVVVGPTSFPYLASTSVFDLLVSNNVTIGSVSPSMIPYRSWV